MPLLSLFGYQASIHVYICMHTNIHTCKNDKMYLLCYSLLFLRSSCCLWSCCVVEVFISPPSVLFQNCGFCAVLVLGLQMILPVFYFSHEGTSVGEGWVCSLPERQRREKECEHENERIGRRLPSRKPTSELSAALPLCLIYLFKF